jgi:hypothetical protein
MNLTGILLQHWLTKNLNKGNQCQRFICNIKDSSETVKCKFNDRSYIHINVELRFE